MAKNGQLFDSLKDALERRKIVGLPEFKIWATTFANDKNPGAQRFPEGRPFETTGRRLIAEFLGEACLNVLNKPGNLSPTLFNSRLQTIFGFVTTSGISTRSPIAA